MGDKTGTPETTGSPGTKPEKAPTSAESKAAHPSATARAESQALQRKVISEKKKEMEDLISNPRSYLLKGESWVTNKAETGWLDSRVKSAISDKIDEQFPEYKPYLDEAGLSSAEDISKFKSVINAIIFEHYTKTGQNEDNTENYTKKVLAKKLKELLTKYKELKKDIEKPDKKAVETATPETATPAATPPPTAPAKTTAAPASTETPAESTESAPESTPTSPEEMFDLDKLKTGSPIFDKILSFVKTIIPAGFFAKFSGIFEKLGLSMKAEFSGLDETEKQEGMALKEAAKMLKLNKKTMAVLFKDTENMKKVIKSKKSKNIGWEKYLEKFLSAEEQEKLKKKPSAETKKANVISEMLLSEVEEA